MPELPEVEVVRVATARIDSSHMPDGYSLGVFAKELRAALRDGECDLVMHSCKDVPLTDEPDDLRVAAVLKRGDAATTKATPFAEAEAVRIVRAEYLDHPAYVDVDVGGCGPRDGEAVGAGDEEGALAGLGEAVVGGVDDQRTKAAQAEALLEDGRKPWVTLAEALPHRDDLPPWAHRHPATTIVGSFEPDKVAPPTYRKPGDGPRQHQPGTVSLTLDERLLVQGFPTGWHTAGPATARGLQVGNAIPPTLAEVALDAAGITAP